MPRADALRIAEIAVSQPCAGGVFNPVCIIVVVDCPRQGEAARRVHLTPRTKWEQFGKSGEAGNRRNCAKVMKAG